MVDHRNIAEDLYFVRIGSDSLDEVRAFQSRSGAAAYFRRIAAELAQYGQAIEGSIHIAPRLSDIVEYPDYVLSLGPRGGLRIERA